jgi:hypothetical protein
LTFEKYLRIHGSFFFLCVAGIAARSGRSLETNQVLGRVREALRVQRTQVQEAFDEADLDGDGRLSHLEVVRLLRHFVPGVCVLEVCVCMCERESRALLSWCSCQL